MGVSRQPVRDAFNRLGNLGLLKIRPQRPTIVRGFSLEKIQNARFVRLSVELEIVRLASQTWSEDNAEALATNIDLQREALTANRPEEFHELDYAFHAIICESAGRPMAFETIRRCKQQVDRLCMLSLARNTEGPGVLNDHCSIADAFRRGASDEVIDLTRQHLSRLDDTIDEIHETHTDYFE